MARPRRQQRLNVFLNGRHVGLLNRAASGAIDFQYDRVWLDWEFALPVSLSLPLREERYIGLPVTTVFDNLLPDNTGIRRQVAERVGAGGIDAFSLLAALGRDCVGALQFVPEDVDPGPVGRAEGDAVSDAEIAETLRNLARNPLGLSDDDAFRISIAGAQEKTAFLRRDGCWMKPSKTTPTTHIFKPQIGRLPNGIDLTHSVENEYLCLTLARALGLPAATVEMASFEDRRVLIVERFDRREARGGRLLRVPQEDCCQALSIPWTIKYESEGGPGMRAILGLLTGSDQPEHDQCTFLKANILFWLLGATDGHGKNFSIFLSPGGRYRLTPLYDVVSAQPSHDAHQIRRNQFKLAMAVGDRRHYVLENIYGRHFVQTAEKAGLGRPIATAVIDEMIATVPLALEQVLNALPHDFPDYLVASVAGGVRERIVRLVREGGDEA